VIPLRTSIVRLLLTAPSLFLSTCCLAAPTFAPGIQTGTVQNAAINEASGIAASRKNANVLWVHDDSGNPAQVLPMTPAGTNLGTYTVSGTTNIDWEDIAVGPGPVTGQYLYIGDIGDNNAIRPNISVYRVPEPTVSDTQLPTNFSISGAVKLTFVYPDGARDAESLFVDPLTRDIYIISKRDTDKHLYRAAYPQATSGVTTLQLMTIFPTDSTWLTAADISPDGNEIIVRSTGNTSGRIYVRPPGGSITDAFNLAPTSIPLRSEPQGEAIGFDPDGWGYYTVSEGVGQPIYYFDRVLQGDFNHDDIVDAADYVAWKKGGGTFTPADYNTWRENFGESAPGGGAGSFVAVPEPVAWLMILARCAMLFTGDLRADRSRKPVADQL
jgi:hypothetical protein